jgi:hypothetical protein
VPSRVGDAKDGRLRPARADADCASGVGLDTSAAPSRRRRLGEGSSMMANISLFLFLLLLRHDSKNFEVPLQYQELEIYCQMLSLELACRERPAKARPSTTTSKRDGRRL